MPLFHSQAQSTIKPNLRFVGPDTRDTIYIEDAQGKRTPLFAVTMGKPLSVYRITPTGHHEPFFTSTTSMSGTSTIEWGNWPTLKMKISWEGMQLRREFPALRDKLSWFPGGNSGRSHELKDDHGTVLAYFKTAIGTSNEPRLDVLVPCDDFLVDLIIATGLTVYRDTMKEVEQLGTAGEILGQILGA